MYVVIMGSGRLGAELAEQLSVKDHDVVVIDHSPGAFEKLGSGFNGITIVGTGIDLDVQKKAGADRADVFAALSSDDNTNIMAAQVAKEIYKVPKVIARIYDPRREYAYHQLGLESICPTNIGADIVRNYIESDVLCCRLTLNGVDLIEFPASLSMAGKKIEEIDISGQVRVMTIARGGNQHVAGREFEIAQGDILMAMIAHSYRQEFKRRWFEKSELPHLPHIPHLRVRDRTRR